jgi:hypothetical protein
MAGLARVVLPDHPQHVTQGGNGCAATSFGDHDCTTQDCVLMGRHDGARIFRAAAALIKRNRNGCFATNRPPQAKPTSIELRAPLRYTGTRLRPGEQGIPGRRAVRRHATPEFIANISKA